MKEIDIFSKVGAFAENKDIAREIRTNEILPALDNGEKVILNFEKVDSTTQSFIHALISDLIRKKGADVLDNIYFKNCGKTIEKLINIVISYMQEND